MDKIRRQQEIVKSVATEPWTHSYPSLAIRFGVNQVTIQRDFEEMKENGYQFTRDGMGRLYLHSSGWNRVLPVKAATLRQMEILRLLSSNPQGLSLTEIHGRFNRRDVEEVSAKTLERALKALERNNIISSKGEQYVVCSEYMLPPIQLTEREKTLLLEALNVAGALAPIPDEMKTLEAKLKLWIGKDTRSRETLIVHGRTPTQDVHSSQCCLLLEEAAQSKQQIEILYRKEDEPAREIKVNPLGIVYYWVLDNWYLIAQDQLDYRIKTYLVNRILDIRLLAESFSQIEGFDLRKWYQYSWGVYRDQNPVSVTIRFHNHYSTLTRVRAELSKRKTCSLIEEGEGLLMKDQIEGLDELAVWLRGFGAGAEVLEPRVLREKVVKEFSALLQIYGGSSNGCN